MRKKVVHQSKITERRQHTITGTLCNRMSNAADDLNVADTDAEVTCKFCLKIMESKRRGVLRAAGQPETPQHTARLTTRALHLIAEALSEGADHDAHVMARLSAQLHAERTAPPLDWPGLVVSFPQRAEVTR